MVFHSSVVRVDQGELYTHGCMDALEHFVMAVAVAVQAMVGGVVTIGQLRDGHQIIQLTYMYTPRMTQISTPLQPSVYVHYVLLMTSFVRISYMRTDQHGGHHFSLFSCPSVFPQV
jgi:hypothetical protein